MFKKFQALSRFVADESRPEDRGLRISLATLRAYEQMIDVYEGAIDPWLRSAPAQDVSDHMDVYVFVKDYIRTIYMIRAMNRLILEVQAGRIGGSVFGTVNVVEAGCGSGFLAGVALALSNRVSVQALDYHPVAVDVTKVWLTALGKERQSQVIQRDLLKPCFDIRADVLVAEHLALGLKGERCVQIPRNFDVDPFFAVPYAVVPCIHWESVLPGAGLAKGQPIILADREGFHQFLVTGEIDVPATSRLPVNVGTSILWGCNHEDWDSLHQKLTIPYVHVPGRINHLCQLHSLSPGDSRKIVVLANQSQKAQKVRYTLSYPVGEGFGTKPQCSVQYGDAIFMEHLHGVTDVKDPGDFVLFGKVAA